MEDILPLDLVDELCALQLEGQENWEDTLLQGHDQGGGRPQTAPGTVDKGLPPELKWRLLHILADLFPVLDDLVDREPRLVDRKEATPWRGYQWPHRVHSYVSGCRRWGVSLEGVHKNPPLLAPFLHVYPSHTTLCG